MGKGVKEITKRRKRRRQGERERISRALYCANRDLSLHISDALAVARTAVEECETEECNITEGALRLIWHKLEKMQECQALLTALGKHIQPQQAKRPEMNGGL